MSEQVTFRGLKEKFRAHARECESKPRGYYSAAVEVEWCADELERLEKRVEELRDRLLKSRAHTYSSENADHYRGFDVGQRRAAEALTALLGEGKGGG